MKDKKILVVIFGTVLLLAFFKLIFSNTFSVTGLELSKLREETVSLSCQNDILKEEISRFASLSRIWVEAANLGFGKPSLVLNLTSELPVALK